MIEILVRRAGPLALLLFLLCAPSTRAAADCDLEAGIADLQVRIAKIHAENSYRTGAVQRMTRQKMKSVIIQRRLRDAALAAFVKGVRARISSTSIAKAKEHGNETMVADALKQLSRVQTLQTMSRAVACAELPKINQGVTAALRRIGRHIDLEYKIASDILDAEMAKQ